jgi:hypothetical protein
MINELWNAFPRLLVQKINALLDEAEPNAMKAFQLYKACQSDGLWIDTFEKFSRQLETFFSVPKTERRKSQLDALMERPVGMDIFENFHLNFRNAVVSNKSILDIANWSHHLIRVGYKTTSVVISEDVLAKTLRRLTNPSHFEGKDQNVDFEDFCEAWKKTVYQLFGKKYDPELKALLNELVWVNAQIGEAESSPREDGFFPTIYLTQTEIDWTLAVRRAAFQGEAIPKFPLSRGPQKQRLIDLDRTIQLFNIVRTTRLPELLQHRDKIRQTILERCEGLIREKAA